MPLTVYGSPVLPVVKAAFSDSVADQQVTVANTWQNFLMADGITAVSTTITQTATYLPLLYSNARQAAAGVPTLEVRAVRVSDSLVIVYHRDQATNQGNYNMAGLAGRPVALTAGDVIRVQLFSDIITSNLSFRRSGCGLILQRVET